MKLVIVTGLSGAGRTQVLRNLEDMNYFCMDNLPPVLITSFVEMCLAKAAGIEKAAIAVDGRSRDFFSAIYDALKELESMQVNLSIIFMDASDEVLVRRYNESRRIHPLSKGGRVVDGITTERQLLQPLKERANYVLDTSAYSLKHLRMLVRQYFGGDEEQEGILVSVVTFGFKHGIPADADMVFDVRFLPNPFYIESLRHHSGIDPDVSEYIFSFEQTGKFLEQLVGMITYLLPFYAKEDKNQLVIAIGCTGGMHRSVAIAEALFKALNEKEMRVFIEHRDIVKDLQGKAEKS